jgi:hypothetical protein
MLLEPLADLKELGFAARNVLVRQRPVQERARYRSLVLDTCHRFKRRVSLAKKSNSGKIRTIQLV